MAKQGMLGELASKTVEAGREHVAKVLTGEETLPEAAGAAVEDLLAGSKGKSSSKATSSKATGASAKGPKGAPAVRKKSSKPKAKAKKKSASASKMSGKKSKSR